MHTIAWEKICQEKAKGGLAIRNLKNMNKAFLAKLAWHFLHEPNRLWAQILWKKYGSPMKQRNTLAGAFHIWKGILTRTKSFLEAAFRDGG